MAQITEKLIVTIDHCIPENPFYLCWISPKGRETWLFGCNQTFSSRSTEKQRFGVYVDDIETATHSEDSVGKEQTITARLFADNITTEEEELLSTIHGSHAVYWLSDNSVPATPKWQKLRIAPSTYERKNSWDQLHDFEITVELPKKYLQRN